MEEKPQSRISITRCGKLGESGYIEIEIIDEKSNRKIFKGKMNGAEFSALITGLADRPCKSVYLPNNEDVEHYGKRLCKQRVRLNRVQMGTNWHNLSNGEKLSTIELHTPDGCEVENDGLDAHQDDKDFHNYVIRYYE